MKELNSPVKFMLYSVLKALRHPRTLISYYYCPNCKLRFNATESECPKCHEKVGNSPDPRQESPIPWWGAIIVICLGVAVTVVGAFWSLSGLERLGDYLIAIPLGHLFGMSLKRTT